MRIENHSKVNKIIRLDTPYKSFFCSSHKVGGFWEPFGFFDQYPHMWFWQWQINFFNQISFKNVTFFLILDYIIRDNMRQYDIFQKNFGWSCLIRDWKCEVEIMKRKLSFLLCIFWKYVPIFCVNFFFRGWDTVRRTLSPFAFLCYRFMAA